MTALAARSAFPVPVDQLLSAAVDMAIDAGEVPSRNRLIRDLRIGAPRANTIRQALDHESVEWGLARELLTDPQMRQRFKDELLSKLAPLTDDEDTDGPHLHLVTTVAPDPGTDLDTAPGTEPDPGTPVPAVPVVVEVAPEAEPLVTVAVDPGTPVPVEAVQTARPVRSWPVLLLALPAFVAIWSGWVGLGELTGFGVVHPLPGIFPNFAINTAITLPIGVETYAAYALRAWLSGRTTDRARRFAKWSAIGSLFLGSLGQITYHLMSPTGPNAAPWPITTAVACLPVLVLGMGAALAHLQHDPKEQ